MSKITCDSVSAATTPAIPRTKTSSMGEYVATPDSLGKYVCALQRRLGRGGFPQRRRTKARRIKGLAGIHAHGEARVVPSVPSAPPVFWDPEVPIGVHACVSLYRTLGKRYGTDGTAGQVGVYEGESLARIWPVCVPYHVGAMGQRDHLGSSRAVVRGSLPFHPKAGVPRTPD